MYGAALNTDVQYYYQHSMIAFGLLGARTQGLKPVFELGTLVLCAVPPRV